MLTSLANILFYRTNPSSLIKEWWRQGHFKYESMLLITFSRSFKIGWIRLSQTLDAKISPFLKLNLLRSHLTSPRLTSYHKSVNVGAYHGITPSLYPADISYMCMSQGALAWLAFQSKAVAAPYLFSKVCQKAILYIKGAMSWWVPRFFGK